jgi:hypothetical protein
MVRLGNFDGDGTATVPGTDELAIGFRFHASNLGAVVIVKGSSSFGSMTIPDPAGVNTIEIDGVTASGQFGISVVGIGQFFPSPAGPALVVGASAASSVYAFRGQSPAGVLTAAAADDSVVGPVADAYGANLGYLGPLGVSPAALTVASTTGKYVDVHLGTAATGPLLGAAGGAPAASVRFVDTASGNSFGVLNLGGGVKGTSQAVSFIGGDDTPDLVLAGQGESGTPIYLVSGAVIPTLSGTVNVAAAQTAIVLPIIKVANRIPAAWGGYAGAALIRHSNDDVYPDFAIGESAFGKPGRVVVFY